MSRPFRAAVLLFVFLAGGFFFSGNASAVINGKCDYTVSPSQVKQGAESTIVTIGIDPSGPRTICGQGSNTNCYEIYTCDESTYTVGSWCHNDANFQSENQSIGEINGKPVIQSVTPNLQYPRHFWLEYVDANGQRDNDECPGFRRGTSGPRVDVIGALQGGVCDAGWVTVQKVGDPNATRITEKDRVRIVYNADKTHGFRGGYAAAWAIPDGDGFSEFHRVGDLFGRLNDPQERLDSAFGSTYDFGPLVPGNYKFVVADGNIVGKATYCEESFNICDSAEANCVTHQSTNKGGTDQAQEKIADFTFCGQLPAGSAQREACMKCDPDNGDNLYTAIGCIRLDEKGFARDFITIAFSIAGMIAFLSILAASFLFTVSQGDSGRVKEAKELMTAAISGLLFIIFSIIILDFIGVQLLRIPGLS